MQVCTSLQTDNHANTSLLSFLQAGCPSCRPTNSVKALKAQNYYTFAEPKGPGSDQAQAHLIAIYITSSSLGGFWLKVLSMVPSSQLYQ